MDFLKIRFSLLMADLCLARTLLRIRPFYQKFHKNVVPPFQNWEEYETETRLMVSRCAETLLEEAE